MGPSRKRTSARISQATQNKLRSLTANPTAPGGGYIEQKLLYTVPCKRESNGREERGVKEETEGNRYNLNRIKREPSDWTNVTSVEDSEVQSNSLEKRYKIKDEPEECDYGQNTSQELVRPSVKAKAHETLQDQKWILKDKEGNQNFPTEDKKVKSYTCFCGKSYTCTSHLNRHRKSHGSEGQFPDVQINSQISEEKTIERNFTCQCGKQYTRKSNLKRHQNNCNGQPLVEPPESPVTYNEEDQEEKFKPYVCACGKSYTSSSHLYRHQRTHLDSSSQMEKRYICDCGKTYSCSSHLYRHQRTHTEEKVLLGGRAVVEDPENLDKRIKPYICFCGKRYTCSSHLYRHQKVHHVELLPLREDKGIEDNEMESRYVCDCGKSYSSPSHLYRHQRTHKAPDFTTEGTDLDHCGEVDLDDCREKLYKCECGKSFILSFSLLLHKKIHCRWKHTSESSGD
ncbi:uncharacterized protein ACMZJ9_013651 [Mantella aurantiaca]